MLVPYSWQDTDRNLQAAITSSVAAGDFWARSRNLKFLRNIHRLDAGTTGILLMAKSPGALNTFGDLFENRQMKKTYLAVVKGVPKKKEWKCDLPLEKDEKHGETIVANTQARHSEEPAHLSADGHEIPHAEKTD